MEELGVKKRLGSFRRLTIPCPRYGEVFAGYGNSSYASNSKYLDW